MTAMEPRGCLATILSLFGIRLGPEAPSKGLPYRLRDDFLSPAEFSFYQVLARSLGGRAVICPKVRLGDIFFVGSTGSQGYRNKIDRKHVDFLLCDPATMKPRCGIELDDASHARRERQRRDEFVDHVFEASNLPLVRVPAKAAYNPSELAALLEPHLSVGPVATPTPVFAPGREPPVCPKCGISMVERVAKKGPNAGKTFFGCSNYPKCREFIAGN